MRSLIFGGLIFLNLILTVTFVRAQANYVIGGKVTDESQKPLPGATVFVDGSQIATATNDDGVFRLVMPGPGSYHVSVQMIGYNTERKDLMLQDESVNLEFILKIKPVALKQVNIGGEKNRNANLEIFKKHFLGVTPNGLACKIINPEVLNFSTQKNLLVAGADDFLIIENPNLGYRIKYLLKTFQYNKQAQVTAYDGEVVFEEMQGSKSQKEHWAKNRLHVYNGSVMHYLRSVFANTTQQEGFITRQLYKQGDKVLVNISPIKVDSLVTKAGLNFVSLKLTGLQITYNPQKAAQILKQPQSINQGLTLVADSALMQRAWEQGEIDDALNEAGQTGRLILTHSPTQSENPTYRTDLLPYVKAITIDAHGRVFSGYFLSFLLKGDWTYLRVGDQLPFEYIPPAAP